MQMEDTNLSACSKVSHRPTVSDGKKHPLSPAKTPTIPSMPSILIADFQSPRSFQPPEENRPSVKMG